MKELKFFNATVQNAFDCDEAKFAAFNQLMLDYAHDELEAGISKKEANAKIVSKMLHAIGCDEHSDKKAIRRGIRRNMPVVFDLLEDVIQSLLVSGWQRDNFFDKFVEIKNLALGDKN